MQSSRRIISYHRYSFNNCINFGLHVCLDLENALHIDMNLTLLVEVDNNETSIQPLII